MTEGKLQRELVTLYLDNDEHVCPQLIKDTLDKVKKKCPMLKLIDPSNYGGEFPTKEVLQKRQIKLLFETYKWVKEYFGD